MTILFSSSALALALSLGCASQPTTSPEAAGANAVSPAPVVRAVAPAGDTLGVPLLTRAEWGAEPVALAMTPHTPDALTIHHTATPQRPDRTPAAKMKALQRFSLSSDTLGDGRPKKPWADVPYHFYIATDGTIVEGRDPAFEGDTNTNYDLQGQIQIVVEGNFMEEEPTDEQLASLIALAGALSAQYGIPPSRVGGHRDRATGQTACPGDALEIHFPAVLAAMQE